jgi:hypothetical protein
VAKMRASTYKETLAMYFPSPSQLLAGGGGSSGGGKPSHQRMGRLPRSKVETEMEGQGELIIKCEGEAVVALLCNDGRKKVKATLGKCNTLGCNTNVHSRGLCQKHGVRCSVFLDERQWWILARGYCCWFLRLLA